MLEIKEEKLRNKIIELSGQIINGVSRQFYIYQNNRQNTA